jgi:hypothetical protein
MKLNIYFSFMLQKSSRFLNHDYSFISSEREFE